MRPDKHVRTAPGFTLVEIMIVVAIIGLLISIAIPNFIKMRATAQAKTCVSNLRILDQAKQTWALESKKGNGVPVGQSDIIGPSLYIKLMPLCPAGGTYDLTTVGVPPSCPITGHAP